jgi:hypothetical protein
MPSACPASLKMLEINVSEGMDLKGMDAEVR